MCKILSISLLAFLGYSSFALSIPIDSKHGYIMYPPSRAFLCSVGVNKNCGAIQYQPQSIEGIKGFPLNGPKDGEIASAGNPKFHELDEQNITRWHHVPIAFVPNTEYELEWKLTAPHRTTSWQYFMTKKDWNPSKPLARNSFESTPFCERFDNGSIPTNSVKMRCKIPERKGYNLMLGVWTIADTPNAFYQVVDLEFN